MMGWVGGGVLSLLSGKALVNTVYLKAKNISVASNIILIKFLTIKVSCILLCFVK